MNVFVGVTDWDWYVYLRQHDRREVNFWKPSGKPFKALQEGDLFLFKLKANKGDRIAGGGFFVSAPITTIDWAWRAFGDENGVQNLTQLGESIWRYKSDKGHMNLSANVTCIILTDVFYLDERDWIDISGQSNRAIVTRKSFKGEEAVELARKVQLRLAGINTYDGNASAAPSPTVQGGTRIVTTRHRIGQGAFRTLVADAYHRRCAITGERTLPVLEAAHIKSFASEGPHSIDNGILLRSDMHALFDNGYLTFDYDSSNEARIVVSPKLHDDFGNGKDYYPYHGCKLAVVPERASLRPAREYLDWHHENVFLG